MIDNSNKLEKGWLTSDSKISIVVPCYNEEECLTALAREMKRALDPLNYDWEVLLINDCSTDSTWKMMKVINHWDSRFKAIHLAYNSGQTAGTLAGIRNSTGDAVITMDADLQHHPQDIPKVLALLNEGHAVVSSWRYDRADEPAGKRIPSRISNSLARLMTGVPAHDFGSGFKGYYAPRLSELILYGSFHRYIPALILQPQDTLGEVRIDYRDRIGGKTKYGATRILKGVRDLIYITMITRLKGNILANLYANFMVYLHYDQGRDTYRIASKIGFD
jgi:glycosyltransferase involved in cell wall biosynthesis